MRSKWKHIACILQLASHFIYFHHHCVPLYKHTAVYVVILLLVDSLGVSSVMNSECSLEQFYRVPCCPRAGASQCVYTAVEFLRQRLHTQSTCPGKVKLFQSEFPSSTPTSTDERSCCFTILPTFGLVPRFNFCPSDGYEIHWHCSFHLQLPDYQ